MVSRRREGGGEEGRGREEGEGGGREGEEKREGRETGEGGKKGGGRERREEGRKGKGRRKRRGRRGEVYTQTVNIYSAKMYHGWQNNTRGLGRKGDL